MANSLLWRAPVLPVVAFVLASVGCVPNVAWLPDSSGFVYTGGKDGQQLLAFDLATKKARVLVEDVRPGWPALSPDGKRIALARYSVRDKTPSLTVYVFDRAGKRLHRSREMPWGRRLSVDDRDFPPVAQVAWSPKGERVLLADEEQTGIYDLKTHKLVAVKGIVLPFGSSPVRPDGKGAIVVGPKGVYWVDWEGKASRLEEKREDVATFYTGDRARRKVMPITFFYHSRWEGPVARLSIQGEGLRFDTKRLRAEFDARKGGPKPPKVRQSHSFAGGIGVRLVEDGDAGENDFDLTGPGRLEVLRPGKPPEVLLKAGHYVKFYPSPDGKWLAVRWYPGAKGELPGKDNRILVLDARGKKVADLKAGE